MAMGIRVKNDYGELLISDSYYGLTFLGKYEASEIRLNYGYIPSRQTYASPGNAIIYTYQVPCSIGVPVPFISIPQASVAYSITAVKETSPGSWYIEVVSNGFLWNHVSSAQIASNPTFYANEIAWDSDKYAPKLYIFSSPQNLTPTGNIGIQVFNDYQQVTFDSRLKPLSILDIEQIDDIGFILARPQTLYNLDPKECQEDVWSYNFQNTFNVSHLFPYPISFGSDLQNRDFSSVLGHTGIYRDEIIVSYLGLAQQYYSTAHRMNFLPAPNPYPNHDYRSYYWGYYRSGLRFDDNFVNGDPDSDLTGSSYIDVDMGWVCPRYGGWWYDTYKPPGGNFSFYEGLMSTPYGTHAKPLNLREEYLSGNGVGLGTDTHRENMYTIQTAMIAPKWLYD